MMTSIKNAVTKAVYDCLVMIMRYIRHTPNKDFQSLALSLKCFRLTYRRQIRFWTMKRRRYE